MHRCFQVCPRFFGELIIQNLAIFEDSWKFEWYFKSKHLWSETNKDFDFSNQAFKNLQKPYVCLSSKAEFVDGDSFVVFPRDKANFYPIAGVRK